MTRGGELLGACLVLLLLVFAPSLHSSEGFVREPAVAGTFYPSNKGELISLVRKFMERGPHVPVRRPMIRGIVAPHAGYPYSGETAARAYREVAGTNYDLVVLLGPSHFVRVEKAAIMLGGAFRTPVGTVSVDADAAREIYETHPGLFEDSPSPFLREHSLEVQLPFLQVALGNFTIVPIEVNILDGRILEKVADAIFQVVAKKNVLIVASTDLSHYRMRSEAKAMDNLFRKRVKSLNYRELAGDLTSRKCEACGGAATVVALALLKKLGATSGYVTGYADSGDTTGDTNSVVGYLSALVFGNEGKGFGRRRGTMKKENYTGPEHLNDEEKRELLAIARKTVTTFVGMGKLPDVEARGKMLKNPGAAFVTIEIDGKLRGCIGYTKAIHPLYRTVMECSVSAATEDPRFSPLTPAEMESIEIEISVLTPLRKVDDLSSIQVGRHGLMISKGHRRGLLLPQVAVNNDWDRQTFLSQTCVKAGLPPDAWKKGADVFAFEAQVFNEHEYR